MFCYSVHLPLLAVHAVLATETDRHGHRVNETLQTVLIRRVVLQFITVSSLDSCPLLLRSLLKSRESLQSSAADCQARQITQDYAAFLILVADGSRRESEPRTLSKSYSNSRAGRGGPHDKGSHRRSALVDSPHANAAFVPEYNINQPLSFKLSFFPRSSLVRIAARPSSS